MPVNRTTNIPFTLDGDKVTLSKQDWDYILTLISDRDVSYSSHLSLRPKAAPAKMKRTYKKRKVKIEP
jgi:hypothetical protein